MNDETTPLIVEIAKEFIGLLQVIAPAWERGFFRFQSEPDNYGSNASYAAGEEVVLIGTIRNNIFFDRENEMGRKLIESFGKTRGLFLLSVDSNFDYSIKFEWEDLG